MRSSLRIITIAAAVVASSVFSGISSISAHSGFGEPGCVNHVFAIAMAEYGWNPNQLLLEAQRVGFAYKNVGDLREGIADFEVGINDRNGVYHGC